MSRWPPNYVWRLYKRLTTTVCALFYLKNSGLDTGHWDFQFCGINPVTGQPLNGRNNVRCKGKQFLSDAAVNAGQDWYNSRRNHGIHVAGIVAASGLNGKGVAGMLPDEDFCLLLARVFDDNGGASLSKAKLAIQWAVDNGAKVINMSLGTSSDSSHLRDAIKYARARGIILVGSAGNLATSDPNYPATYPDVLGVSAVNSDNSKAYFSNYGDYVDIAAMGVQVLSTRHRWDETPKTTIELVGSDTSPVVFEGNLMIYSKYIGIVGIDGELRNCGKGNATCPGEGGHICYIAET